MLSSENATVANLKKMTTSELLALFKTLTAPTIAEMNGEYAAILLKQPSLFHTVTGNAAVYNPFGLWLCKAFRPVSSEQGRGYNTFQFLGKTVQRYAMQTVIAPSRYDGLPAYQLVYRAYYSLCADIYMVDEVRKVDNGIYLGIGTCGLTHAQRQIPLPFLLTGAIEPYRGDIGKPRKNFHLVNELAAFNV